MLGIEGFKLQIRHGGAEQEKATGKKMRLFRVVDPCSVPLSSPLRSLQLRFSWVANFACCISQRMFPAEWGAQAVVCLQFLQTSIEAFAPLFKGTSAGCRPPPQNLCCGLVGNDFGQDTKLKQDIIGNELQQALIAGIPL